MILRLERLRVVPLARSLGAVLALAGLVPGVLYAVGGAILDVLVTSGLVVSTETAGVGYGTALACLALVGMPLISGAIGVVTGAAFAALYNMAAKRLGGIEVAVSVDGGDLGKDGQGAGPAAT